MYFNEENNKTNIDLEFNDSIKKFKISKSILLVVGIIIAICCIVLFFLFGNFNLEYFLILEGSKDMTIYQNSSFVDPGYLAYDSKNNDYTNEVIVTGEVNTSIAGEYILEYSFNGLVEKRVITVIGENNQVTYLNLNGNQVIYLKVNEDYKEPGYMVLDSVDANLKNKVIVTGEVNTKKAGTYKITYSVVNSSNVTITAERTVIVMDSDIAVNYQPTNITNADVVITVNVQANYFDYVLLPDGTRSTQRNIEYKVKKNDKYIFKIYNRDGSYKETEVTINNIDKDVPSGSCVAVYDGNKTDISVTAKDNTGISSYNYIINGKNMEWISANKYVFTGNGSLVKVDVKDKAGNVNSLNCSYKNDSYKLLYTMTVTPQATVDYPCNLDVSTHNQKLAEKVKQYGYKTRAGVVAAATYLTKDLGYKIGYWWAGKYDKVGLNTEWGCPRKEWDQSHTVGPFAYGTVHPFGLDCSGFVKWAFVNAGFEPSLIPRGDMTYYYGTVWPKVVKFSSAGDQINNIKPGDLLLSPGHVVLVVAVSDTQIRIAQSVHSGIREDLVDKKTGKQISRSGSFDKFVLLEEFYKKYGN